MGAAGAEGCEPALSGGDVEDAGEDETVGDKDGDAGHKDVDAPHNEHHQLIDVRAGARELEHREDVTEIMVDGVGITEGQSQQASSVGHGTTECHEVCTKHKAGTHFRVHGDIIQKWGTDGHIAIIGH